MEEPEEHPGTDPQPTPADAERRARRRRTALVTGRWVASAAVIAAMTAGTAAVNTDDGPPNPDSISYTDPPDDAS